MNNYITSKILSLVLIFTYINSNAQKNNFWKPVTDISSKRSVRGQQINEYKLFRLDYKGLINELSSLNKTKTMRKNIEKILSFPNQKGELQQYRIKESSVMEANLQDKYPDLRSYIGININQPSEIIRFSTTSKDLQIMIMTPNESTHYIERLSEDLYILYSKDAIENSQEFECLTKQGDKSSFKETNRIPISNSKLYTIRLALACTGEYSDYHINEAGLQSASDTDKKAIIIAEYNNLITRISGIYERDISTKLVLVSAIESIIFLNKDTDPYIIEDNILEENQVACDDNIGTENYDLGHVVGVGGGGFAYLKAVCLSDSKAGGMTALHSPKDDAFYVDYVAHEIGHQLGAEHTFNSSCDGNVSGTTSVEPGSGSTIMAYAGICPPNNVQSYSDDYFHNVSIRQIINNLQNNFSCLSSSDNNNSIPVISDVNSTYYIPKNTPFVLDATVNDADGNSSLTYCWEQIDKERSSMPPSSSNTVGPMFRSLSPTNDSSRYFPKLETILSGNIGSKWEVTPSVSRNMNFTLTVRDNDNRGGQIAYQSTQIIVTDNQGGFNITSQNNTNELWYAGNSVDIKWDVAHTDTGLINCEYVDVYLSQDGGDNFDILVASKIPNTGNEPITVPNNIDTTNAMIMIKAFGNVFYDINDTPFEIKSLKLYELSFDQKIKNICDSDTVNFNFTYNTFNDFSEEVSFTSSNLPQGIIVNFNPDKAISDNTPVEILISGINNIPKGSSSINILLQHDISQMKYEIHLNNHSESINPIEILNTNKEEYNVNLPYELKWVNDNNIKDYYIQVSESNTFENLILNKKASTPLYTIDDFSKIKADKIYYWRVKGSNPCKTGYSEVYNFDLLENETLSFSNKESIQIPEGNSSKEITSEIEVEDFLSITNIDITVNISHRFIADLEIKLISPNNNVIILKSSSPSSRSSIDMINTVFNDDGTDINESSSPHTGIFKPVEKLSTLNKTYSKGTWILSIKDNNFNNYTGELIDWSLEIEGQIQLDIDNDNIIDSEDDELQYISIKGMSPNNDGINDTWTIDGIDDGGRGNFIYPKVNVFIHNRQGVLIYQKTNYDNSWDGTYKNKKVPTGNYHVQVQSESDNSKNLKTWIYLTY